ncbi:hypothetical protein ABXV19_09895 [Pseudomonas alkylphenolica]|uniref:hypothetical protein n=1 Tax=Pseudomonas alkylphenolica TaxID=237609 RepID=UPI003398CB9B
MKWGIGVRLGLEKNEGLFMLTTMLTIIAAAVAAYSAVLKTKHEKLWSERYEKSALALTRANIIVRFLESEVNGEHGIHGLTAHEKQLLNESWPVARYELERDILILQLLFNEQDMGALKGAWTDLQRALFLLMEEASTHDSHAYVRKALPLAELLEGELIMLARKKCVFPFYARWLAR